jgi:hypothetical protein
MKTIVLSVVLCGCVTWSLTLMGSRFDSVLEQVLGSMLGPAGEDAT